MIIVEGPDNSGKTTLANQIAQRYDVPCVKSVGAKANYDWWMEQLKLPGAEGTRQVRDRFFFSELVYGPIFRGKVSVTTHQQEVILSLVAATEPLVIRCHFNDNFAQYVSRKQDFPFERMMEVEKAFCELEFPFPVVEYDWRSLVAVGKTFDRIREWWERRTQALMNRATCFYGRGPCCANVMVVGIDFSSNNRWKVPFERSQSAILVHQFLREIQVDPVGVYFTNAEKKPGGLTPYNLEQIEKEWGICKPSVVLAFGRLPSTMLSVKGIAHVAFAHPGSFIRRGKSADWLPYALGLFHQNFISERS